VGLRLHPIFFGVFHPMPITDTYARLPLSAIYIDREGRQRRELDTRGLIESIKLRGVLNPIIVERATNPDGKHKLTAGERRYQASFELHLLDIPVRFAEDLSSTEAQIFELEENMRRADLTWQEAARAYQKIHSLYCQIDPNWTQDKTAWETGVSKGTISIYLAVAENVDTNSKIQNSSTLREAYNIITRKAERGTAAEMDRLLYGAPLEPWSLKITPVPAVTQANAPVPSIPIPEVHDYSINGDPAKNILHDSFLTWGPVYSGPAFNLIHCDFPYGIGVFGGPQSGVNRHESYDDSAM
jgi:ParB/RepB/Spo0J family partition protein